MFEFDKYGVSFKDDDGDEFSLSMAFGNFLKWFPNDATGTAFLTSDMCRGIGRIMRFFAEKGCLPTSEEDLMAWVCGDAAEETTTPTTPSTDGTLAAIQDRLDEVEERLASVENQLAAASTPAQEPTPQPVEKTPQQLADEMSERFPVGTRVDFWTRENPEVKLSGIIYRKFYARYDDGCPVVTVVGAYTPTIYTAAKVEPATWAPVD